MLALQIGPYKDGSVAESCSSAYRQGAIGSGVTYTETAIHSSPYLGPNPKMHKFLQEQRFAHLGLISCSVPSV